MSESPILTTRQGRVGVITLNRPAQLNALNDALMDALGQSLIDLDADPAIGAIVITGNDKAFAAGANIAVMADWSYMDVFKLHARFASEDAHEGMHAFLDKRPPVFHHR